jgi:hypothetical protein
MCSASFTVTDTPLRGRDMLWTVLNVSVIQPSGSGNVVLEKHYTTSY